MTRHYTSRRRAENAAQTRQAIIDAAIKLHGEGITTFSAVAEEAGVSLPTVSKYFPTREDLFEACTTQHAAQLTIPKPETLMAIANPVDRLRRVVQEVYRLHEETLGQMWLGYKLEDESPTLARAIGNYEAVVALLASAVPYDYVDTDPNTVTRFVRAALSPLTYRALRMKNELSFEEAVQYTTLSLAHVLNI